MYRKWTYLMLAGAVLGTSACDAFGPDDDAMMNVRLSGSAGAGAMLAASLLGDGSGAAPIAIEAVDSINMRITAIEAVRVVEGEEESWIRLELSDTGKAMIDLLDLPVAAENAWLLARGEIPAGTYSGVRIRFDVNTATITLNQEVTVGNQVYAAGTYPLTVPSGAQSGLKVPFATMTIGEDATADVSLTFDGTTSVHTVATGSGKLILSPVLHSNVTIED